MSANLTDLVGVLRWVPRRCAGRRRGGDANDNLGSVVPIHAADNVGARSLWIVTFAPPVQSPWPCVLGW